MDLDLKEEKLVFSLSAEKKLSYTNLIKSAQDIESTIGSTQYRIHKFILMREEVDRSLKSWWESVINDLDLDPKNDYVVTQDGCVTTVKKPVASETLEVKSKQPEKPLETIDDLK